MQHVPGRPPFRADHVGSLLRPAVLRQAFRDYAAKRIDDAAFAQIQDDCIRAAVQMQQDVGLAVVTDGEFRRGSYWGRFVERAQGFAIKPAIFNFRDDRGEEIAFTAPYATEKLRRTRPLALDEFVFLRGATTAMPKITLPAPSTMHFYRCTDFADKAAYASVDAFFADLGCIFRDEVAALAAAGCKYVQFDEVAIAMLCDPATRKSVVDAGQDPDGLLALYVDSINDAVSGAPPDVIFAVHVCRGNLKGRYLAAGGYDAVAECLFRDTRVNHFLLEYDTARAGDFSPLRFADSKGVVLGLISSKVAALESLDDLKRRTAEAARYLPLDQLALSPQCGFASTVAGNPIAEEDQRAKLQLTVEAARAIWR